MSRCDEVVHRLKSMKNAANLAGMARYGIRTDNALGVSMPVLRRMGKDLGRDHGLAEELWNTGIHEARILASLVAEPSRVTRSQMDRWAKDFDSWDVCDQVCMNLFGKTPFAYEKALVWSRRREEFVKRAGFALMAVLAWHDKEANDARFEPFFERVLRESTDERNYVRKAVNWALRNIGKRNRRLNRQAIATAKRIARIDSRTSRWIAHDAMRELGSAKIQGKVSSR